MQGSLRGEKIRKSLDLKSWEAASDLIAQWHAAGEIGSVRAVTPSVTQDSYADSSHREIRDEDPTVVHDGPRIDVACRMIEQLSQDWVHETFAELVLNRRNGFRSVPSRVAGKLVYPKALQHLVFDALHNGRSERSIGQNAQRVEQRVALSLGEGQEHDSQDVLEAWSPRPFPDLLKHGNELRDKEMSLLRAPHAQRVELHQISRVARTEEKHVGPILTGIDNGGCKITVGIEDGHALARDEICGDEIPEQGRFTGARSTDDEHVIAPIISADAEGPIVVSEIDESQRGDLVCHRSAYFWFVGRLTAPAAGAECT